MVSILSVFWYYKDNFYGPEGILEDSDVCSYGEYSQLDYDHFLIWDKYAKKMGLDPLNVDYCDIPRGRILFHIPTHRYVVIGSKALVLDSEIQNKICDYYGLPPSTDFRWDEHYT